MTEVRVGPFRATLGPGSFLTDAGARYALRWLWEATRGDTNVAWEGEPVLSFSPMTKRQVDDLHSEALATDSPCWTWRGNGLFEGLTGFGPRQGGLVPFDLPTAIFLGLSRWEEAQSWTELDEHERALPWTSLAHRGRFMERPILDEWAVALRPLLAERGYEARPTEFRITLSHDLDHPRRFSSPWRAIRAVGGVAVRDRSPTAVGHEAFRALRSLAAPSQDPYMQATLEQLDLASEAGVRSTFNLMFSSPRAFDRGYDPRVGAERRLLEAIRGAGHRIGWHPGYAAADDPMVFSLEYERARALGGVEGGRFHYLRWRVGIGWERFADFGLKWDSSLGYEFLMGFRCWTSAPFPVFSFARDEELRVVEEPLVVMDNTASLFDDAPQRIRSILDRAQAVGGRAMVLLHNSEAGLCGHEALLGEVRRRLTAHSR